MLRNDLVVEIWWNGGVRPGVRDCRRWAWRRLMSLAVLIAAVLLAAYAESWSLAAAQEGTPAPGQEIDACLVSVSAERREVRVGESMHLWIWGAGVEPGSWELEAGGDGSLSLRGARELDPGAEFVEWTVVGEREGEVTVSVSMACRKPGIGTDYLTLSVLPPGAEPTPKPAAQPTPDSCIVHLSVSDREVEVGDEFSVWFVGVGTEERSWGLAMEGDGSAELAGTRELDPEYVEWRLEAVSAGTVGLVGRMDCLPAGEGASSGEIVIVERGAEMRTGPAAQTGTGSNSFGDHKSSAWGTATIVQAGLMAALIGVLVVLVYVLIRRR